jgi:hypothetical protein
VRKTQTPACWNVESELVGLCQTMRQGTVLPKMTTLSCCIIVGQQKGIDLPIQLVTRRTTSAQEKIPHSRVVCVRVIWRQPFPLRAMELEAWTAQLLLIELGMAKQALAHDFPRACPL